MKVYLYSNGWGLDGWGYSGLLARVLRHFFNRDSCIEGYFKNDQDERQKTADAAELLNSFIRLGYIYVYSYLDGIMVVYNLR